MVPLHVPVVGWDKGLVERSPSLAEVRLAMMSEERHVSHIGANSLELA